MILYLKHRPSADRTLEPIVLKSNPPKISGSLFFFVSLGRVRHDLTF